MAQTPDDYIAALEPDVREALQAVRAIARAAAPGAEERMSYGMPTLFWNGVVAHYGGFKRHIGLFPPPVSAELRARAAQYAGPKGNLKFPIGSPPPSDLIAAVVSERLAHNLAKSAQARASI